MSVSPLFFNNIFLASQYTDAAKWAVLLRYPSMSALYGVHAAYVTSESLVLYLDPQRKLFS